MKRWCAFTTCRQLIRDTFRQSCASGICWMMLAVTAISVLLCLSVKVSGDVTLHGGDEPALFLPRTSPRIVAPSVVSVLGSAGPLDTAARFMANRKTWFSGEVNPEQARQQGVDTISGRMTLAFGAISLEVSRDRRDAIHFLQLILAGGFAGTLGLLLALVWTAGFVPAFLEPTAAAVLLAKPVARWQLLLGKYCGVLIFVGSQVLLFIILTWLALGMRTGIWEATYWWCIPLLLIQFAIFFSFSVLLAVVTRSTVACVFGSVLFWLLAWGINYGCLAALGMPDSEHFPAITRSLAKTAYWVSPKPIDSGLMLFNALDAEHHFEKPAVFRLVETAQGFSPVWSILSCLLITMFLLSLAAYELNATDY